MRIKIYFLKQFILLLCSIVLVQSISHPAFAEALNTPSQYLAMSHNFKMDDDAHHWHARQWSHRNIFNDSQRQHFRSLFLNHEISGFNYNNYYEQHTQLPMSDTEALHRGHPLPRSITHRVVYLPTSFGKHYLNIEDPYYKYGVYGNSLFVYDTASNHIVDILNNALY